MVRSLLLLVAFAMISIATRPVHAQQIFLDFNDDGSCDYQDIPAVSVIDTVDVWIDTSTNLDGSPAVCGTGEELTIAAYEVILRTEAGTSLLSWTNSRPEFAVEEQKTIQANVAWVGYSSFGGSPLAPGRYLLGRAGYQHTMGCPFFAVVPNQPSLPGAETKFSSQCPGSQQDYFIRFGSDFYGSCGSQLICDGVESTTWGHIKDMYR